MNVVKLGDYLLNGDDILWIKRIGCGARVVFKQYITADKQPTRAVLEIATVPDEDWRILAPYAKVEETEVGDDSDDEH